uniref:Uncharacterized protein n=1 Tax=Arundo donax TaxID=35708 RepID=A0A0A9CIV0_ARUDO
MLKDVVFRSSKLLNYVARNYKVNISIRKKNSKSIIFVFLSYVWLPTHEAIKLRIWLQIDGNNQSYYTTIMELT